MTSAASAAVPPPAGEAPQRVIKVRRDYNSWVASETLEDYALRFTPRSFRKWSELRVAQTGFGGAASFLVLEAVGATLLVEYGFLNAFWAIIATGLIIFLAGLPISLYAARHGVDMDLLTRGAGFGYIGSTITSLIYASFTFDLLRARGGHHGLRAGAGLRHPAGLGLPGLRAAGDPAGHARGDDDQPAAGVDPAAVAGAAGAAVRLRVPRGAGRAAWPGAVRRPGGRAGALRPAAVRRGDDGGHRADDADGRAGRLPALHAREDRAQPRPLVGRRAAGRAGLGGAGHREDAGRRAAGVPGDQPFGAGGPRGRPQPDVPGGLRLRVLQRRLGGGGHRGVRRDLAAQDQRHQRLRGLAGLVQLLRARHPQPPGAGRVGGVQHADRADADGAQRVPGAGQGGWGCTPTSRSRG